MKRIHSALAALAVLPLALCACHRRDASQGSPLVSAALPGAVILPEPLPADLPPPTPTTTAAADPAPSAEEVAAFHAPVPK